MAIVAKRSGHARIWWCLVLLGLCLGIGGWIGGRPHDDEYSFLNRFHPQRVKRIPTIRGTRSFVMIFSKVDAPNILPTLKKELGGMGWVSASAGPLDGDRLFRSPFASHETVGYFTAPWGRVEAYDPGHVPAYSFEKDECAVITERHATWLETQLEAVDGWFHWR